MLKNLLFIESLFPGIVISWFNEFGEHCKINIKPFVPFYSNLMQLIEVMVYLGTIRNKYPHRL